MKKMWFGRMHSLMIKHLLKKWRIQKPIAETMDGWYDWKENAKKEYPIRYYFQETLPHIIKHWWLKYVDRPYWELKYRLIPKHRYHMMDTGLTPAYYELNVRMLHACFNEFKDFYEYQLRRGYGDWIKDESKEYQDNWAEMTALYDWWVNVHNKPNREEVELIPYPKLPSDKDDIYYIFSDRERDTPVMKEWRRVSKENEKITAKWKEQETEMFIRLIKIRDTLWGG